MKWQAPPEVNRGRNDLSKYASEAAALRAQPGKWALVIEGTGPSIGGQVRAGRLTNFPKGEFEATSRKRSDGKYDVYVRFVGDPS